MGGGGGGGLLNWGNWPNHLNPIVGSQEIVCESKIQQ